MNLNKISKNLSESSFQFNSQKQKIPNEKQKTNENPIIPDILLLHPSIRRL